MLAVLFVGLLIAIITYARAGASEAFNGPLWTAGVEKMQLSIVERGALESSENSEIVCRVKASGKGSTVSTTIKWIIDDGTQVVRGQKLIELDDAGLQEQLKNQIITVNKAKSEYIFADENLRIQQSQNFSDIETAKNNLVLAQIDIKKYLGDGVADKVLAIPDRLKLVKYLDADLEPHLKKEIGNSKDKSLSEVLQTLDDIGGRIEIARSDREQWLDRASWSQRMVKKGYLSRSQAESDKARLDSAEIALKKVQGELDIYRKFTVEKSVTELWGKFKEAERALDRTITQAKAKEVQAISEADGKRAIYLQEEAKKADVEREIDNCTLFSPQDGMVVYIVPEQNRMGTGQQQNIVAQGEPVREGQKLMRIPNLSRMLVNTRVHEAMVSRLRGETTRPTGFSEAQQVAMTIGRSPLAAALSEVVYDIEFRPQFRERDVKVIASGQPALIRVESFPSKIYKGHVKTVATVPSAADFLTSDVKVYQTMVAIDEQVEGLKPGMSAEVTIIAEESKEPILMVPIQSVVGSLAMGANRKVFVLDGTGQPKETDIVVGRSNDRMVEVIKGISEGAKVVLNPRPLLGEKSDMRPGVPGKQRGADSGDFKKKKGGGPPPGGPAPGGPPQNGGPPQVEAPKDAPPVTLRKDERPA